MAAHTFLHTVDKRATAAIWRESVEKGELELEAAKHLQEKSIEELIEERNEELRAMTRKNESDYESTLGAERYKLILELSNLSTAEFKKMRRKNWTKVDYLMFAGRMLILLLKCFKERKQYVEEMDYLSNPSKEKPVQRYMKNKSLLQLLTCNPTFRNETHIEKISYFLRPLTELTVLFPTDMFKELCRRITYTDADHGRIIRHQNEKPMRFYFVLDGKINKISTISLSQGQSIYKSVGWINKHEHNEVFEVENYTQADYQMVAVCHAQMLYLNSDDFQVLRKVTERVPRLFLSSLPLFKDYPLENLLEQLGVVTSIFFEPKKVVCKNLKQSEYFYICKSGSCAIIRRQSVIDVKKKTDLKKQSSNSDSVGAKKLFLHAYETSENKLEAESSLKFLDQKRPSMPAKIAKGKYSTLEKYTESKSNLITKTSFVKIGEFRKGDIAGLHEQSMGRKEGVFNLSLVSEGTEVVVIHKKRFLLLAVPRTLAEIQVLFATYKQEEEIRDEVAEKETWNHYQKSFVNTYYTERQRQKLLLKPRGNPNLTH